MAIYGTEPAKILECFSLQCFIRQSRGPGFSLFQGIILSHRPIPGSNIQNVNKIMKSRANALKKYKILRIHISTETSKGTSELMQVNS